MLTSNLIEVVNVAAAVMHVIRVIGNVGKDNQARNVIGFSYGALLADPGDGSKLVNDRERLIHGAGCLSDGHFVFLLYSVSLTLI